MIRSPLILLSSKWANLKPLAFLCTLALNSGITLFPPQTFSINPLFLFGCKVGISLDTACTDKKKKDESKKYHLLQLLTSKYKFMSLQ